MPSNIMGESADMNNDVPIFKKRARSGSTRKRRRATYDQDEEEPRLSQPAAAALQPKAKPKRRAWERDEYVANGTAIDGTNNATAQREDVGGQQRVAAQGKPKKPFGPMSAPTNIRTSVRVDYQADVCKDYKETGYCGFGDACKFLHDRSDYKMGWQLDRDWAEKEKARRERVLRGEDPDEDAAQVEDGEIDKDGLPFACYICRNGFVTPVVTLCGHYFCEDCALSRMAKYSTCAICKRELSGTLNPAKKLQEKIAQAQRKHDDKK